MTLCTVCSAQKTWYLQDRGGSWKRYSKEIDWTRAAQKLQPLETVSVNQTSATISVVYDVQGESGDWRNVDRYTFLPNGPLVKLQRKLGSVSQDILLTQEFELDSDGKPKKTSESEESLNTGKPRKEVPEVPQLPVATNIKQLEFMKAAK